MSAQLRQSRRLASEPSQGTADSPHLTTQEAAAYLRFPSANALRHAIRYGLVNSAGERLPVLRRGRTLLFHRDELDRWLHGQTVANVAPFGNPKSVARQGGCR